MQPVRGQKTLLYNLHINTFELITVLQQWHRSLLSTRHQRISWSLWLFLHVWLKSVMSECQKTITLTDRYDQQLHVSCQRALVTYSTLHLSLSQLLKSLLSTQSAEGLEVTAQLFKFKIQINSYLTPLLIHALEYHPDFSLSCKSKI